MTKDEVNAELAGFRTLGHTVNAFKSFVDFAACDGEEAPMCYSPHELAEQLLNQLKVVRKAMEASALVQVHEFIGSSLLLLADGLGHTGVYWIDFAKTHILPEGVEVTHRKP